MAKKKKSNKIPTFYLGMMILGLLVLFIGSPYVILSIVDDGYTYYDDFNSGLRTDLWDTYEAYKYQTCSGQYCSLSTSEFELCSELQIGDYDYIIVDSGQLKLRADNEDRKRYDYDCMKYKDKWATATSIKTFTSEDIEIKYTQQGKGGYIKFGEVELPLQTEGKIQLLRYDDLDLSKYIIKESGEQISEGENSDEVKLEIGGTIDIDYVKYKPYFSCSIDAEFDVVVLDKFSSGSIIKESSLTYKPTKLCPDDLGVIIISEDGLTKEKGSLTKRIAQGEIITVPEGQTYQVRYITKYVDDMQERCNSLDKVYSTELKKCIDSGVRQEIATSDVLYCEQDSDCIVPSGCGISSVPCLDNQCDYSGATCTQEQIINEVLVQKTIEIEEPTIVKITEGYNDITITNSDIVAGYNFYTSKPDILCTGDGYIQGDGCYETTISWGDYNFKIKNGETEEFGSILFAYEMTGRGAYTGTKNDINYVNEFIKDEDWENTIVISFDNVFEIKNIDYSERLQINSDSKAKITINNTFMEIIDGGFKLKQTKSLRDIDSEYVENNIVIPYGVSSVNVEVPTDELGIYTISIIPYINLKESRQYLASEQVIFGYYVENQVTSCSDDSMCSVGQCVDNECIVSEVPETKSKIPYDLIIIILVFVLGIGIFIWRMKKSKKRKRR